MNICTINFSHIVFVLFLQYGTRLLLLNFNRLIKRFFYQLVIRQFGNMSAIIFEDPVDIREYVRQALDHPVAQWSPDDGDKDILAKKICNRLKSKRDMLCEYFTIGINNEGHLTCMPILLMNYLPLAEQLPLFLLRLATVVNWNDEKECFSDIAKELSLYYSILPIESNSNNNNNDNNNPNNVIYNGYYQSILNHNNNEVTKYQNYTLNATGSSILLNIILPAMNCHFIPPKDLAENGCVTQIAALEQLYKVFERC